MRRLLLLLALALPVAAQRTTTSIPQYGLGPALDSTARFKALSSPTVTELFGTIRMQGTAGNYGEGPRIYRASNGFVSVPIGCAVGTVSGVCRWNLVAASGSFGSGMEIQDSMGRSVLTFEQDGTINIPFLVDSTVGADVGPMFRTINGTPTTNTLGAPVRGRYNWADGLITPAIEINGQSNITAVADSGIVVNAGDRAVIEAGPGSFRFPTLATGGAEKLVTVNAVGQTDTISLSAGGLFVASVGATWPLGSTGGLTPQISIVGSSGTGRVVRDTGAFLYNMATNQISIGGGMLAEDAGFVAFTGQDFLFGQSVYVQKNIKTYGGITADSAIRQKIRYQDADSILVLPGNQVVYTQSAPEGGFKAQLLAASLYGAADFTGCIEFSDARGVYGSYKIYPSPGETIEGADDDGTPGSPLTLTTKYGYAKVCRTAGGADRTWFVPQKK